LRLPAFSQRRRVCGQASSGDWANNESSALTPVKPRTAYGEMLQYYLKMEPELFQSAMEDQLNRLKEEREEKEKKERAIQEAAEKPNKDKTEVTLYKRMEEVRASEIRATLEDLMYMSILEKFVLVGVPMLPRLEGEVDVMPTNLKALTEGIHSKEALEMVREHLLGVMGPTAQNQFSNAMLKMSKFQMAQVYAASIMFGYFLRRVDKRFQLEKSLGTLPMQRDEAVERLNQLFAQADSSEDDDGPSSSEQPSSSSTSGSSSSSGSSSNRMPQKKPKSALRSYVEQFDQAAMVNTARIVSAEGGSLVERQTSAVLGDIKKLTAQIQAAVGTDATSLEEVMMRMAKAVETDAVETLTMTVGTQRRAVLEAVAFGTFLRDVESWVDTEYQLLTPLPPPKLPPGGMGGLGGPGAGGGGSPKGGDTPDALV